MISKRLFRHFYPGVAHNGTAAFYKWLRSYLTPNMRVLNVGAGPPTNKEVRVIKGEVKEVVGSDIDPIIFDNRELDSAFLIKDGALPFEDQTFDCAYADYVLEHVADPSTLFRETHRVLKPGASFFFRTPNRFHYVALFSDLTPQWVHRLLANAARGLPPNAHEPWPTFYRANTARAIRRYASLAGFATEEIRFFEPEPSYLMFNSVAFLLGVAYERIVNSSNYFSGIRANLFGRLTKPAPQDASRVDM
jgi:SAM-dependent methyltransferase